MVNPAPNDHHILSRFTSVRELSEAICRPLETEDYLVQPFAEVSPPKWHLAHTSWFFENFILKTDEFYQIYDDNYFKLFNSYYKSQGEHWLQGDRGSLSRPRVKEIMAYRHHVTSHIQERLLQATSPLSDENLYFLELGIHHEQQHQELLLMDIKRILWHNINPPSYADDFCIPKSSSSELKFIEVEGGLCEYGHNGRGFAYDNEGPRHKAFTTGFAFGHRPITNAEYLNFVEDGGYQNSLLWLSDGWDLVQAEKLDSPLYWKKQDGEWGEYQLSGFHPLDPTTLVSHVSFYEASAYALWSGCRLPTEYEWERVSQLQTFASPTDPLATRYLEPSVPNEQTSFEFLHGGLWEWTLSAYLPYPGYKAQTGALGEYNSKFMNAQRVLRGGCYATPSGHYRPTYRNFYQAEKRWPFTGIRLAKEI